MRLLNRPASLCLALLPLLVAAADPTAQLPLQAVIDAERAFSARAQVIDARDAFVEHFAPDAIAFGATPGPAFPALREGPPWGVNIRWRPTDGGIARSGDLGWTTGPAEYRRAKSDKSPFRWGHYTSVWQRQADGGWKVVIDVGVTTPVPTDAIPDWAPPKAGTRGAREAGEGRAWVEPSRPTTQPSPHASAMVPGTPASGMPQALPHGPTPEWRLQDLLGADRALALRAATDGSAFRGVLRDDSRVHRDGKAPALGRNAAFDALRDGAATYQWTASGGRVAEAGDLGFTYGVGAKHGTAAPEPFHYLAIWDKRGGAWALRVLVLRTPPAPPAG